MTIPTILALSVTSDMLYKEVLQVLYNFSLLYYLLGHDKTANLPTTGFLLIFQLVCYVLNLFDINYTDTQIFPDHLLFIELGGDSAPAFHYFINLTEFTPYLFKNQAQINRRSSNDLLLCMQVIQYLKVDLSSTFDRVGFFENLLS